MQKKYANFLSVINGELSNAKPVKELPRNASISDSVSNHTAGYEYNNNAAHGNNGNDVSIKEKRRLHKINRGKILNKDKGKKGDEVVADVTQRIHQDHVISPDKLMKMLETTSPNINELVKPKMAKMKLKVSQEIITNVGLKVDNKESENKALCKWEFLQFAVQSKPDSTFEKMGIYIRPMHVLSALLFTMLVSNICNRMDVNVSGKQFHLSCVFLSLIIAVVDNVAAKTMRRKASVANPVVTNNINNKPASKSKKVKNKNVKKIPCKIRASKYK